VDFAYSDEQEQFRETLRRFFEERSPSAAVRRAMATGTGWDPGLWKQLSEELGLPGVALPERFGGQGFGFLELGIVLEEMGRALVCAPYFSTVCLAANAILAAGDPEAQRALLPRLARGEATATLAWVEPGGGWRASDVRLAYERDAKDCVLSGVKDVVVDGHSAELVLVAARRPGSEGVGGLTLLAVEAGAPGLRASARESLDPTRRLARLELDGVRGRPIGPEGAAGPALEATLARAAVCLAAEQAGGAARCLEMAVAYARERIQFGRPIGSFQAIQHRCAEVLLEVESARAAAAWAAWVASEEPAALPEAASLAQACCAEAYLLAARENVHIHGGLGVTWEHDAQLHYKRAKSSEILLGDPAAHRAALVAGLGLP
jgi:alkylation response protein AidB-like acyl-CoA dehydrogenase